MMRWVIAYDIPDDRRRTRIAALLEGFGDRVQHSVFEAVLNDTVRHSLERQLRRLLNPEEDTLRLYPLCNACAEKVVDLGRVARKPFDEPDLIIV